MRGEDYLFEDEVPLHGKGMLSGIEPRNNCGATPIYESQLHHPWLEGDLMW